MHWDYLKRWTNFRRQLSKRNVTPKINFHKNKEITQNSSEASLVRFFVISLSSSWHSNKACQHCSTQKPIFIFLTSFISLSAFYVLFEKHCHFIIFSLCMMFGMHFDNDSVLLNSVATAYVHLATSSVTMTCWFVYTAKLEIHTRFK